MGSPRSVRIACRLVAAALKAFPHAFRAHHRDDQLAYFQDRARDRLNERGLPGLVSLTALSVVDAVVAGLAERRRIKEGSTLLVDLSDALRSLRRHPRFVVAAALPIALGLAGVTAVLAVADGVLLRPLPYPDPARLVKLGRPLANGVLAPLSTANLFDLEGRAPALTVGGVQGGSILVFSDDGADLVQITRPTRHFADVLAVRPALGRGFVADDFEGASVAMVTWGYWQRVLGGDPEVLALDLDTELGKLQVVGVVAREWRPPDALRGAHGDIWVPLDYGDPMIQQTRAFGFTDGVARLAPGADMVTANAQLHARALALAEAYPEQNRLADGPPRLVEARSLHAETVGDIGQRIAMILGAVGVLLAIACANVANLFLARGVERRREMALRAAMGAGRLRLVRQSMFEAVVVCLLGGVVGGALAWASVDVLVAVVPDLPRADAVHVDLRVLLLAGLVTLVVGALSGSLPAWQSARTDPGGALHSAASGRGSGSRVRGVLVSSQIALAVMLVSGGGLLVNSVVRLGRVELGFRAEGVAFLRPRLRVRGGDADGPDYFRRLAERLQAVPGVSEVSGSMFVPGEGRPVVVNLEHPITGDSIQRLRHTVLPGLFRTLDVPLFEGRDFDALGDPADLPTVVVSRALAEEFWPGRSAVGQTLRSWGGEDRKVWTVRGVVEDILTAGPAEPSTPLFYESYYEDPWLPSMALVFRLDRPLADVAAALRAAAASVDRRVPVAEVGTLDEQVGAGIAEQRGYALLLGLFSLLALGIAAVGVYATMSFTVSTRLREMGIRRAVGAGRVEVVGLVLRKGAVLATAGVVVGVALALAVNRGLESLLFRVTSSDPATYVLVAVVLTLVALAACVLPARRASTVDPVEILRWE